MALSDDERRALRTRLAPGGDAAADAVARAVEEGEELREVVVDAAGDVVAFTDRRALVVPHDAGGEARSVAYDDIEVRRRDDGLGIDVALEGGKLVLHVARGTFMRLAVVGTGAPPGRATWLPAPARPAPKEPPAAPPAPSPTTRTDPVGPHAPHQPAAPAPAPTPASPPPGSPLPAGGPLPPPIPPVEPQPAVSPHPPVPAPHQPAAPVRPPVPAVPPQGLPPAGWHPDPSGRHWWRWWDGLAWTDHVADGGPVFTDPLPPRR